MACKSPQILRVGKGYSANWTVELRDATPPVGKPILDTYNGDEPLGLVICGEDGASKIIYGSTVTWLDPDDGTITLHIDDSDTMDLGPGSYGLSIELTDAGEPFEVFRAVLRVEPRSI